MIDPNEPEGFEQIRRAIAEKLGCITQQQFVILTGYTLGTEETKRKRGEAPPHAVVGNTILYPLDTLAVYVKGRVKHRKVSLDTPTTTPAPTLREVIEWVAVADELPDIDANVLMAWDQTKLATSDTSTPFQPEGGWLDAEGWHLAESGGLVAQAPTWWAAWPNGPSTPVPGAGG